MDELNMSPQVLAELVQLIDEGERSNCSRATKLQLGFAVNGGGAPGCATQLQLDFIVSCGAQPPAAKPSSFSLVSLYDTTSWSPSSRMFSNRAPTIQ